MKKIVRSPTPNRHGVRWRSYCGDKQNEKGDSNSNVSNFPSDPR